MRIGNINGEGRALFSLDSSLQVPTTPSISFAGDENTGIYQPTTSSDHIAIATAGAERLIITNSGLLSVDGGGTDTGYAALVTSENDVPNKKYVDDSITTATGAISLDDLTDVTITAGASNEFLMNNGAGQWVDTTPADARTGLGLDAGGAGDIWVEKAGDTMDSNADLTLTGGGEVLGLPVTPSGATAATSKAYVDALVSGGATWVAPITDPDLVDVVGSNPGTPESTYGLSVGDNCAFIATATFTFQLGTGSTVSAVAGDIVNLTVTSTGNGDYSLIEGQPLTAGDRFGVGMEHGSAAGIAAGTLGTIPALNPIRKGDLIQFVSGDGSGASDWSFENGRSGLATDGIATLGAITAGSGYANATYPGVALTGGTGNGAIADVTVAGGVVTVVTLVNSGVLYTVSDTLSAASGDIGGGAGFSIPVATVTATTEILQGTTCLVSDAQSIHYGHTYLYNQANDSWVEISGPGAIGAGDGLSYSGDTLNVNFGAGTTLSGDNIRVEVGSSVGLILSTDGSPAVSAPTDASSKLRVVTDGSTIGFSTGALYVPNAGITEAQLNTSVAGAGLAGGAGTALSVGVTTNGGIALPSDTLQLDISDLGLQGSTIAGTELIAIDGAAGVNKSYSLDSVMADLGVPNGISTDGIIINNSGTYSTVSIAVDGAGPSAGLKVTNADGTAGNPTVGLDIDNMAAGGTNLTGTDLVVVHDGTNNVSMTGQEMADGLSTLLTIDNTKITDGTATFIDTDATAITITSSVGAGTTHAASSPLTMSADAGIDIVSSTASATDAAGAPITVTGGTGDGNGAGGLVDLEGGVGGATGPGGALNLSGGAGGASGAGGAVAITAGAGGATTGAGGVASMTGGSATIAGMAGGTSSVIGGASTLNFGGAANLTGGAGVGGGHAQITGGAGSTGDGGDVLLSGGDSASGTNGGSVVLQAGSGTADGFIHMIGADTAPAVLRIHDAGSVGDNYIGLTTPAGITSDVTYTLPEAPGTSGFILASTTGGVMSWVNPVSAGADSYGAITADSGATAAGSAGATLSLLGATNGGITTTGSGTPGTVTFEMDINDLSGGTTLALTDSFGVYDLTATATLKYTLQDLVEDLDIVNGITADGIVVRTSADNYTSRSVAVDGAGSLEGLAVTNGDGISGNPTLGLNITGMTAASVDMDATDKFVVFDGTNNVSMVGQDIADGVKTILSLDNTIITDADGTFIDTDATASTITSGVKAAGNFAAGTPLTLSAASTDITASAAASAGNPGAPINITAGLGLTTGLGGAVTISGGENGATASNGGAINLYGGNSGATSGVAGQIYARGGHAYGTANSGGASIGGGYANGTGAGGGASIGGGSAAAGAGGYVTVNGGASGGAGAGGPVNLYGGNSDSGAAGDIIIRAGNSTSGTDGVVKISGPQSGTAGEVRFLESNVLGGNYIGLQSNAAADDTTYTLPNAPGTGGFVLASTTGGVMSWVDPVSAGSFAFGTIVADGGTNPVADSGGDTLNLVGGTNGGITTTGVSASDTVEFALDINDLAAGSATTLALTDTIGVYDSTTATRKFTFTDVVEDLQIPNTVGTTVGFVTLHSGGYDTHQFTADGTGSLDGISVSAGGTTGSADVFIGLDILGTPALGADIVADDVFVIYSPTTGSAANKRVTGQELADGVKTLISLDTTKIVDADGDTWVDVESGADNDTINTAVAAGATNAAGTPLTMSADGGSLITSSAGLSGEDGGVISLTSGAGEGVGIGGAVTATGGAGGASGAGGALTLIAGAGGSTSGAGGAVTITAGGAAGSTGGAGGAVAITGGAGNVTKGGDASICGGDGVGVDGGDATLCGGDSDTGAGGSIILQPGSGATDGTISVSAGTSATEMRFYDVAADNYVGFRAADVLSADTSFVWPTADGSASGDVLITDGSGNLSFASPAAGLTAGEGIDITSNTISLDIGGLTGETITTADELAFWDVTATANNQKTTVANFLADLDIVSTASISTGILTKTADDTYAGRTITASSVAGDQGISLVNGSGVSGNPVIGLDIVGLTAEAGTLSGTDVVALHDGTNNVKASITQIGAGITIGGLSDVTADATADTAGNVLVANGSTAYESKDIQYIRTFTSTSSLVVTHNLGQKWCLVQVYVSDQLVIPASVTLDSANQCTITFAVATAGTVVVMGIPGVPVN